MNTLIKFGTFDEQAEAYHQLDKLKLSFNDIELLHISKDTIAGNTADHVVSDIQKLLDHQLCLLPFSYTIKKWPIPPLHVQENMDEDEENLNENTVMAWVSVDNRDQQTQSRFLSNSPSFMDSDQKTLLTPACMSITTPSTHLTSSSTSIQPPKHKIPSTSPGSTIMPLSKCHK